MPANVVVINGVATWYVGDSKMEFLIQTLHRIGTFEGVELNGEAAIAKAEGKPDEAV